MSAASSIAAASQTTFSEDRLVPAIGYVLGLVQ